MPDPAEIEAPSVRASSGFATSRKRLSLAGTVVLAAGVMFLATACAEFLIPSNPFADEEQAEEPQEQQQQPGQDEEPPPPDESPPEEEPPEEEPPEPGGQGAEARELEEGFISTEDGGDPAESAAEVAEGDSLAEAEADAEVVLRTRANSVYAVGTTAELPADAELGVEWGALEIDDPEGETGYEVGILDTETYEGTESSAPRSFSFALEEALGSDPLPPGSYEATITLDGRVIERLPFSLYDPPPTLAAAPSEDLASAGADEGGVTAEPTDLQFILDGSASMNEVVGGETKLDAAREAMGPLVNALPEGEAAEGINVGMRAYDQNPGEVGDVEEACADIELLSPMEGVDRESLRSEVEGLRAEGRKTPLAVAVEAAAEDFSASSENNAVILVSDGKENCVADPVEAVRDAAEGANLMVHVVGFDISAEEDAAAAREELQEMAEATGGVYADAESPEELAEELRRVAEEEVGVVQVRSGAGELLLRTPDEITPDSFSEFVLYDEGGAEVIQELAYSRDTRENTYQLPEGVYEGEFYPANTIDPITFRVEIGAAQRSVLETGALQLRAPSESDSVHLVDRQTGRIHETYTSSDNFLDRPLAVPPGSYDVWLQATNLSDPALVAEDVEVAPGSVVDVAP
jgi:hypothetical protein